MRFFFLPIFSFIFFFSLCAVETDAGLIDDLQEKINDRNTEVKKLEEEIKKYQEELDRINGQTKTLDSAIKTLSITDKKLNTDIKVTGKRIANTEFIITALAFDIDERKREIGSHTQTLAQTIRTLDELESRSLVEIILVYKSFSHFWGAVEDLERFQNGVRDKLHELQALKIELEIKKETSEQEHQTLLLLKSRLGAQKIIVEGNKKEKERLLSDTKNKESNYKDLLSDRLEKKEALEKEIAEFEARLQVEIDPGSLPPTGTGILSWPLDSIKITQYFGNTSFASENPQVYNGGGHNGIDFGAPIGTPVRTSGAGRVVDTGDTDTSCYKVSYGKWVLVQHRNGLSTIYAHLSHIGVNPGQEVENRDVIGYSGTTGYSTGPHLHFGVYASKAVRVTNEYKSRVCGTNLKLPLSPRNGYLNPLSYLPAV